MSSLSSMFGSCMICYYVLVLIMVLDSVTCISFPTYSSTGPTPLAGWMSNPTTVAHPAVSGGAIGLGAPSISVWDLSACSMPFQAALVKDPGVSVNRVIWSPDGALFGKSFLILRDFCDHGGDEVQQHLEVYAVNTQFRPDCFLGKVKVLAEVHGKNWQARFGLAGKDFLVHGRRGLGMGGGIWHRAIQLWAERMFDSTALTLNDLQWHP
ncbi:hypothetical protein V8G54_017604 [Vigna mungo]|uniref:Uncharacterized protein n=1 Tax=Vigna mungo TaxID=3915 RepID=A0AAQ3RYV6_VIGMU